VSWLGRLFLIIRCRAVLYCVIACIATDGLPLLTAEHLACAQLCAEAHRSGTLLLATYKKTKNLPLSLLGYVFGADRL
jgi:hypothetical protein